MNIDSSATFDRKKPARDFRRWKALPEIKETVLSLVEFVLSLVLEFNDHRFISSTYAHHHTYFARIFRVLTCKCLR
jgi:hypothetical protein